MRVCVCFRPSIFNQFNVIWLPSPLILQLFLESKPFGISPIYLCFINIVSMKRVNKVVVVITQT